MTPLTTSRGSRHGRPPLGLVLFRSLLGKLDLIASHCSSVRSTLSLRSEIRSAVDPLFEDPFRNGHLDRQVMRRVLAAPLPSRSR